MASCRYRVLIVALGTLIGLAVWPAPHPAAAPEDLFVPKCSLPFTDKSVHHPIDTQCSPSGLQVPDTDPDPDPHHQQNRAKNHLYATSPAVPVTIRMFDDLQETVEEREIPFGNQHVPNPPPLPANRSELKDLVPNAQGTPVGEGTNVAFVAYVLKTKIGSQETLATILEKLRKHPVRITGQMFFDASHSPCGHPEFRLQGDPKRRSLWEIHPVYKIEACKNKTLAGGKIGNEAVWKSLDAWVADQKAHP